MASLASTLKRATLVGGASARALAGWSPRCPRGARPLPTANAEAAYWRAKIMDRLPSRYQDDKAVLQHYYEARPWSPPADECGSCAGEKPARGGERAPAACKMTYCEWYRRQRRAASGKCQRRHYATSGKPSPPPPPPPPPPDKQKEAKQPKRADGKLGGTVDKVSCFLGPFCNMFKSAAGKDGGGAAAKKDAAAAPGAVGKASATPATPAKKAADPCAKGAAKEKTKSSTDCKSESKSACKTQVPKPDDGVKCPTKQAAAKKKKSAACKTAEKKPSFCKKSSSCESMQKKDTCKQAEKKSTCGKEKLEDLCKKLEKKPLCATTKKTDPCKKTSSCESTKKKADPCKKTSSCESTKKKADPCKKTSSCESAKKKADPCKKTSSCESTKKKADPCKKTSSCESTQKKDVCKKVEKKPTCKSAQKKKKKQDPCGKTTSVCSKHSNKDPCNVGKKKATSSKKCKSGSSKQKKRPAKPTCPRKKSKCERPKKKKKASASCSKKSSCSSITKPSKVSRRGVPCPIDSECDSKDTKAKSKRNACSMKMRGGCAVDDGDDRCSKSSDGGSGKVFRPESCAGGGKKKASTRNKVFEVKTGGDDDCSNGSGSSRACGTKCGGLFGGDGEPQRGMRCMSTCANDRKCAPVDDDDDEVVFDVESVKHNTERAQPASSREKLEAAARHDVLDDCDVLHDDPAYIKEVEEYHDGEYSQDTFYCFNRMAYYDLHVFLRACRGDPHTPMMAAPETPEASGPDHGASANAKFECANGDDHK